MVGFLWRFGTSVTRFFRNQLVSWLEHRAASRDPPAWSLPASRAVPTAPAIFARSLEQMDLGAHKNHEVMNIYAKKKLWGVSRLPWYTAWWFSHPKNMKVSWMILLHIYEKKSSKPPVCHDLGGFRQVIGLPQISSSILFDGIFHRKPIFRWDFPWSKPSNDI